MIYQKPEVLRPYEVFCTFVFMLFLAVNAVKFCEVQNVEIAINMFLAIIGFGIAAGLDDPLRVNSKKPLG